MTRDHADSSRSRLTREEFLTTGAKLGAGLTLAGAGMDLFPRSVKASSGTLTYMGLKDTANPDIQKMMLKQFEKLHPGVKTQFVQSPTGSADAYHDKLVTVMSAHDSSIDIFDSDVIWQAQWGAADWAVPLDKYVSGASRKQYVPAMIFADTVKNHLYALPWMLDTGHLFYRQDILHQHRMKPAKTWPELAEQSVFLQKKHPGMVGYVGCYQKGQQLICNFLEYAWTNGGDFLDPKTNAVVLNSRQNVAALQFMYDLIHKYKAVQSGIVSMDLDTGRQIFTSGRAVYHRNWNYVYALAQDKKGGSKIAGKVGVTNIPHFDGHSTASCAGGWQYAVNAYSDNRDMAIKLALFLGSPKMELYRALHGGFSPAYLPANYNPQVAHKFPSYPLLAQQAKTARSRPKTPLWTQLSNVAEQEITNALIGRKSPKGALDDAASRIKKIMSGD